MYKPAYFNEERVEKLHEVISGNPFATLISCLDNEPVISHLPFSLDAKRGRLVGHMARANSHWRTFEKRPDVLVVFQGPHAYISPATYPPSPTNVPTWNYVVVHAYGRAEVIADPARAWERMRQLVTENEAKYGAGWSPEKSALDGKLSQIVIFEIELTRLDGKFKLSQQQDPAVRDRVADHLTKSSDSVIRETGEWMKATPARRS